jgi:2-iminobutanoate/2-iminopropanoate deaminase
MRTAQRGDIPFAWTSARRATKSWSSLPAAGQDCTLQLTPTIYERGKVARQIVFTSKAAKPPPTYSQAVKAAGLVFVSGTAPVDPETRAIKGTTIQEQTRQCLTNIQAILEEAGSSLDKLVSVTVVLADEDDFAGMNEEWLRWFPSDPPARQGAKLPARIPGLKVSIAAIAER